MQKSKSVTDRPTDQQNNRPTDRVTYRVACTRLKRRRNRREGKEKVKDSFTKRMHSMKKRKQNKTEAQTDKRQEK